MAVELSIATILKIKEICKYLSLNSVAKANIFKGKALDERAATMIYVEGKSVQIRYEQNPNDPTLPATANYLYSLLGRWALEAQTILNNQLILPPTIIGTVNQTVNVGGTAIFPTTVISSVPYTVQWYNAATNQPIAGATSTSYVFPNAQLTDSNKSFYMKATNVAGTVTSVVGVLVVNATIQAFAWYGSTDPFPALSGGSDTLTYQITQTISHNAPITITWPQAAANNLFQVIKIPITESIKTTWFNTPLNQGTIPDAVFRAYVTVGSYGYIISRTAMSLDGTTLTETFS